MTLTVAEHRQFQTFFRLPLNFIILLFPRHRRVRVKDGLTLMYVPAVGCDLDFLALLPLARA